VFCSETYSYFSKVLNIDLGLFSLIVVVPPPLIYDNGLVVIAHRVQWNMPGGDRYAIKAQDKMVYASRARTWYFGG
jgi:hypothetical protein